MLKILWLLYPLELLYNLGFKFVTSYKKFRGNKQVPGLKVIAVGNLSMGGTGKSVVVPFIASLLGKQRTAIALRGYKGSLERTGQSVLVTDGNKIFVTKEQSGDEAMMYALQEHIPVVVGKNRAHSCTVLENLNQEHDQKITHVILDDAYQNHAVKKDLEVLLLDARAPFGNGHCLPLGLLREKDYMRADVIILTHADAISQDVQEDIKCTYLAQFPPSRIFMGSHASAGIFHLNITKINTTVLGQKKYLVVAGVGSFQGVIDTVQRAGICVTATKQFSDHYAYTQADLDAMLTAMRDEQCDGIVTTAKDWVKLHALLVVYPDWKNLPFYVVRVAFEFLTDQEYDDFLKVMKEKVF